MLIWPYPREGAGRKRSERMKMAFLKWTYWFPIWMLGWVFGWQKQRQKGGRRGTNIVSCQTGALHQATGAGGTPVTWRMMTDGGGRWCMEGFLFIFTSVFISHPHPHHRQQQQQALCLPACCISSASFSCDLGSSNVHRPTFHAWQASEEFCTEALLSPPNILAPWSE